MAKNYELNWARTHSGLTQTEAAEKMGVDRKTFNRWETGIVEMPPARWTKFLKIIELSAKDIPAPEMAEVPKYVDGELSTPYLPMHLQRTPKGDWPPTEAKQWAKAIEEDVEGLKAAWLGDLWDIQTHHDYLLEERTTNVEWAAKGRLVVHPNGEYKLTPAGRAHEAEEKAKFQEIVRQEKLMREVKLEDLI